MQPDVEAGLDERLQVDPAPAHHPVTLGVRPALHDHRQLGLLRRRQPRLRPSLPPVAQAGEALLPPVKPEGRLL